MRCHFCGHPETKVYDTRPAEDGGTIRRRRECLGCGQRFTTFERVEEPPLVVVKRDGRRVAFDRDKLLRGMLTACEKRPVPLIILEQAAAEIDGELRAGGSREVFSATIGEAVMERLRRIDAVAYVRFASVYRQFADIGGFREELDRLQGEEG